jgi:hypothetical protein
VRNSAPGLPAFARQGRGDHSSDEEQAYSPRAVDPVVPASDERGIEEEEDRREPRRKEAQDRSPVVALGEMVPPSGHDTRRTLRVLAVPVAAILIAIAGGIASVPLVSATASAAALAAMVEALVLTVRVHERSK